MEDTKKPIKVLLCLNGDKDNNRFTLDRNGVLLRYALESVNIPYTYNYNDDYNIVHLLSTNQYKAYLNVASKADKKIVLSTFNDSNDYKIEEKDDGDITYDVKKYFKTIDKANMLLTSWASQGLILKHCDCPLPISTINLGVKDYSKNTYLDIEKTAFRKFYKIPEDKKIIITYGEYDFSKGLGDLEAVARMLPDYEFFFFGGRNGILSNSKHYEKTNSIQNLHYEDHIHTELYHSLLMNATAFFIPYRFHVDSCLLLEAMKQGVPIVANKDPLLFDLLVKDKTALLGSNSEEFFKMLNNISKFNYAKEAKEFVDKLTVEAYGKQLMDLYQTLLK